MVIDILLYLIVFQLELVVLFMMSNKLSFTIQNIIEIIRKYVIYLVKNLLKQIVVIIIAVACFFLGALMDCTYKGKNINSNK